MASFFCERRFCATASSTLASVSRTRKFTASHTAQSWPAPGRPRALVLHPPSAPSGRRHLSTTAALQARLIQRPQRPYQFTQVIQLSDGSTFTVRTTNPHPLHRCNKDTRNHIMWQPSDKSLRNVEVDEAGRLAAFRSRFGRGWDSTAVDATGEGVVVGSEDAGEQASGSSAGADTSDSLADLLSGYAAKEEPSKRGGLSAKEQAKKDKKKK